jgi:hypothetical protein
MNEKLFRIMLLGPVSEASRDQLIEGLQQRFKLTADKAEALIRKAPVTVKKGLSLDAANTYRRHLEEIGASVRVEEALPSVEPQETPVVHGPAAEETGQPMAAQKEAQPETYCPWEDMENLGFFKAFFQTIRGVLFHPKEFFSKIPTHKGMAQPLIFALITGALGGVFALFYQGIVIGYIASFFPQRGGDLLAGIGSLTIWSVIQIPLVIIISLFLLSGILHICIMITSRVRKDFQATFRVMAYSNSLEILAILPLLWPIIPFWTVAVWVIGMREVHRTTTARATLAVFLPLIVLIALVAVIVILVFTAFHTGRGVQV